MNNTHQIILLSGLLMGAACASQPTPQPTPTVTPPAALELVSEVDVVLASDIEWEMLNPARGDASPRAGTIWGDRNGEVPTGFLVRFVDGFQSPPHIHNVTYRGVVIQGLVHNDDANAEPMWMPPGSFWTQPAGGAHITAARGDTIAFIEIDTGPYLVKPTDEAFSGDEQPINVDASNLVWQAATALPAFASAPPKTKVAFLWGSATATEPGGLFLQLAAGESGGVSGPANSAFRAVVIAGTVTSKLQSSPMEPGSMLSASGTAPVSCASGADCLLYVRY